MLSRNSWPNGFLPEPLPETLTPTDVQPVANGPGGRGRDGPRRPLLARPKPPQGRPIRDFHIDFLAGTVHWAGDRGGTSWAFSRSAMAQSESTQPEGTCSILGVADHGNFASETRFLTQPGIEDEFDSRVRFAVVEGMTALAVMTDGVADDFFPEPGTAVGRTV